MLRNELKRKGGAEKNRDKKRKELLEESKTCVKLDNIFKTVEKKDNVVLESKSSDIEINCYTSRSDVELSNNCTTATTNSIINLEGYDLAKENKKQYIIINYEDEISKDNFDIDLKDTINKPDDFDYFKKPTYQNIEDFFEFHPSQPKVNIPFNSQKAYYSENNKRIWLSYSIELKKIFCTICIAYGKKRRAKYFCGRFF